MKINSKKSLCRGAAVASAMVAQLCALHGVAVGSSSSVSNKNEDENLQKKHSSEDLQQVKFGEQLKEQPQPSPQLQPQNDMDGRQVQSSCDNSFFMKQNFTEEIKESITEFIKIFNKLAERFEITHQDNAPIINELETLYNKILEQNPIDTTQNDLSGEEDNLDSINTQQNDVLSLNVNASLQKLGKFISQSQYKSFQLFAEQKAEQKFEFLLSFEFLRSIVTNEKNEPQISGELVNFIERARIILHEINNALQRSKGKKLKVAATVAAIGGIVVAGLGRVFWNKMVRK